MKYIRKFYIKYVNEKFNLTDKEKEENTFEGKEMSTDYNGNVKILNHSFDVVFYGNTKNCSVIQLNE